MPAGPGAAAQAEKARTRLLADIDGDRQPRTAATVAQLMERYLAVIDVEVATRAVPADWWITALGCRTSAIVGVGLTNADRSVQAASARPTSSTDQPAVAICDYGPGYVCLGIAGPVERAMAEQLGVLLGELRARGHRELVITLASLGPWHRNLARVLAHARIQHLVNGAHVEFHDLPDRLAADFGSGLPTAFLIVDAAPADLPGVPVPPVRPRAPRPAAGPRTPPGGTRP